MDLRKAETLDELKKASRLSRLERQLKTKKIQDELESLPDKIEEKIPNLTQE